LEQTISNRIATSDRRKVKEEIGKILFSSLTALELLIDYKHTEIQAPHNSGSFFFNYQKTFSVFLLSLVDVNYKFIIIDVGGYDQSSDGLVTRSILGKSLKAITLNIPNSKPPPNSEETLTFVIVGDEAFSLKIHLLRPYLTVLARKDKSKQIYNYRVSRACRFVGSAFGTLTQQFRSYYGRIQLSPENADKVVLAACVLHNYLRNCVCVQNCVFENTDVPPQFAYVTTFRRSDGSASEEAVSMREKYRQFFENVGLVRWQLEAIRRGRAVQM
jgi:hypothetical protein